MARIRSIKPEFPQSESMGRVSRDARLTFVQLWTLADDAGRLRGHSRMLASLLFPYDDDARGLIDKWLVELERENCIQRYQIDGDTYIQVCNWLTHQKIDKPSKSKIPSPSDSLANPRESSREFSEPSESPRERSSGDLRIKEGIKDQGEDQGSAPILANGTMKPEGELAIALRNLGVAVRSIDPVLHGWLRDGFTVQQAIDAVGLARIRKPHPEPIHANYLDKILRQPIRPPPSVADRVTWRPPADEECA